MLQMPTEAIPSIIYSYLTNETGQIRLHNQIEAFNALMMFYKGKITEEQTNYIVFNCIGSTSVVKKLSVILNTSPEPISFPNLNFKEDKPNEKKNTKSKMWTDYEDQRLLAGINIYGVNKWIKISEFVGNGRTKAQCSQRWARCLDPHLYKGPWTNKEDENLLSLIKLYGNKSWKKVASQMGNRSDAQCRYRFKQLQKPKLAFKFKTDIYATDFTKQPEQFNQKPIFLEQKQIFKQSQALIPSQTESIPQNSFSVFHLPPNNNSETMNTTTPTSEISLIPKQIQPTSPSKNKQSQNESQPVFDNTENIDLQINQEQYQVDDDAFFMF